MIKIIVTILIIGVVVAALVIVFYLIPNKSAPISFHLWGPINTSDNVAVGGYDPTEYLRNNRAIPGLETVTSTWQGVEWRFISEQNKVLFEEDPFKFAPQYGGYCAEAVRISFTFDINPESWHVEDGKLYLFENEKAKKVWVEKLGEGVIVRSDNNWMKRKDRVRK